MQVLITGANGQLGIAFRKLLDRMGVDYVAMTSKELDITRL